MIERKVLESLSKSCFQFAREFSSFFLAENLYEVELLVKGCKRGICPSISRDLLVEGGSLIEEGPRKWSRSFDRTTLKIGVISGLLFIIVIYITANLLTALVPYYSCCNTPSS